MTDESRERLDKLKPYLHNFLEGMPTDRSGKKYICPCCDSGSGESGTSALQVNEESWYCHKCGERGDIVDFAMAVSGSTFEDTVRDLEDRFGLGGTMKTPPPRPKAPTPKTVSLPEVSYPEELKNFQDAYEGSEGERYMLARGISTETAKRFGLGFDVAHKSVVIPTSGGSLVSRAISPTAKGRYYAKGGRNILNPDGLLKPEVFVTEGEIDALSLIEAGYNAVGIGGIAQFKSFLTRLNGLTNKPYLILAFDNEGEGQAAQAKFVAELEKAQYSRFKPLESVGGVHPLYQDKKDANELLSASKSVLQANASLILQDIRAEGAEAPTETTVKEPTFVTSVNSRLEAIASKMRESAKVIPIDLECFARALPRQGFTKGLYLLGASPAKGKSALCQQIAEGAAKRGHKVLYFALEMSEDELFLRSIIRHKGEEGETLNAEKAESQFLSGDRSVYPPREVLENLYIEDFETKEPTLQTIQDVLNSFLHIGHDKTPLVVVDYLQLIQLSDKRENADTVTRLQTVALELKKLSRKCPFLVISSLNREGRKEDKPKLESFQGSGSLEYTANWAGILWDVDEPQSVPPPPTKGKLLALHCVKVRSGRATDTKLRFIGSQYRFEDPDQTLKKPQVKKTKARAWSV